MNRILALLLLLPLAGCLQKPPHPTVRYIVGSPYEADGVWRYPAADFAYDETGIASISQAPPSHFTADGERYGADAFAAAHPTLQLPAIARVTNLETGRQIVVRINDRGPADPARILAVTPRVAAELAFPADGVARVRVKVLPAASEALALSLPGGPALAVAAAPLAKVSASALPPLPGSTHTPLPSPGDKAAAAPGNKAPTPSPPVRTNEQPGRLSQIAPAPGALFIRSGIFTNPAYAEMQAASLARFGAQAIPRYGSGTLKAEVRIGPIAAIPEADSVLKKVLAAGSPGARLVVE